MKTTKQNVVATVVSLSLFLAGSVSMAEFGTKRHKGNWDKKHPRQAEVNGRLQNQDNRVEQGQANGSLSNQEANKINRQDQRIYRQEQRMKERNGGNYLTKGQQEKLNKEENGVSKEIKKDEGAAAPAPAPAN